ncbi:amidohydrolase [Desulfovibrio sp. OttesenSCG-928-F07]|nr:amidohydrolase [Desulfovibrio sp. OttesenSCG-928-F07]
MSVKDNIHTWVKNNQAAFDKLALEIWQKPELPYAEELAAKLQMEFMQSQGFTITQKEGMPTAFMAEWNNGGTVFGLLGEYDALGGLSQEVSAQKLPVAPNAPGHACGHNLLGVGCMLAACAAKEALKAAGLKGTIRYYGCPAEEQLTGKGEMAALGYFEGTDISLTWHSGDYSSVNNSVMTAVLSAKFKFTGKSSHAGSQPHLGRSALDAVELMNVGANYLREHMLDQDRLHYVITNGGQAPNIVPADAEVWYFARAPHADELVSLWERLVNVARGAALMTETAVDVNLIGACYNTMPNQVLNEVLQNNLLNFAGTIEYTAEDMAFAREIQATLPQSQIAAALRKPVEVKDTVMGAHPLPIFDSGTFIMGSTDVGDVANIMPTSMVWTASWPYGVAHHSWQATACCGSSLGLKSMAQAGVTLAGAVYDIAADAALAEKAIAEFKTTTGGKPYSPLVQRLK